MDILDDDYLLLMDIETNKTIENCKLPSGKLGTLELFSSSFLK